MMKKEKIIPRLLLAGTVLFNIVLVVAVLFLMQHVRDLLNSDAKINLTEIVTQNKNSITSRLMLEVNNLKNISERMGIALAEERYLEQDFQEDLIARFATEENKESLSVANKEGDAVFADGHSTNIQGRTYFKYAMDGEQNISDKLLSRADGDEVFMICVPLYYDGKIIGTIQRSYADEEMYQLCAVSVFSENGYMYIIDSEGYILLHSKHAVCHQKSDNYFRDLYESGNYEASRQIELDLRENKSGFGEVEISGQKIFSAYTPIDQLHDWNLITSVPAQAVSPNGVRVIQIFYFVLLFVVLFFFSCILYFLNYKNQQRTALEKIAFIDPVTGGSTYNKFVLDVRGILAENPGKQFYLMKFDIDNFRYINTYYGFDYGDKILRDISACVKEKLSPVETLARISGDHFVLLLENGEDARLDALLDFGQNEEKLSIYCSAGLFPIMDSRVNVNLMVDKASIAEHAVKGVMTTTVGLYSEKFDLQAMEDERLKRNVMQAFSNDEFEPFYQPKVDIETGRLVGAEALVRWRTAENKLVPPGMFIPMCEQTGLVVEIDFLMLKKVLQFLQRNLLAGENCVPIAVNFSRLHLLDEQFSERICELLSQYGVPPNLIELELTESAIFDNIGSISSFTETLRSLGFSIAMDDFGSGYSSLNMLKDIPIDTLKIDKGFLGEIGVNERRDIIFSAVAKMAKLLEINVVVEGVEYVENVELMRRCGCRVAQGYYFARPMVEGEFQKITKAGMVQVEKTNGTAH